MEEAEDAHHKDPHTSDGEGDSHQSGHAVEYAENSHHGHSNPDGEEWGNVRGNDHAGYTHGEVGFSCRNHQWLHTRGEESESGMDHGSGRQEETGSIEK